MRAISVSLASSDSDAAATLSVTRANSRITGVDLIELLVEPPPQLLARLERLGHGGTVPRRIALGSGADRGPSTAYPAPAVEFSIAYARRRL